MGISMGGKGHSRVQVEFDSDFELIMFTVTSLRQRMYCIWILQRALRRFTVAHVIFCSKMRQLFMQHHAQVLSNCFIKFIAFVRV
jgi:hypothetical protein